MNSVDQVLEVISQVLIRCTVMLVAGLLLWWGVLAFMGDLTYTIHSRFMPISREQFNAIHYAGMVLTKSALTVLSGFQNERAMETVVFDVCPPQHVFSFGERDDRGASPA